MINLDDRSLLVPIPRTIFEKLDEICRDEDFDFSFIPHIWWGPFRDASIVQTYYTEWNDGYAYSFVQVQFTWEHWRFELDIYRDEPHHECPYCKCEVNIDDHIREALCELTS